jgi:WD40 repeat protein
MTVAEAYIDDPERGPDKQSLKFSVWDPAHPDAPLITLQGLYHRFAGPVVLSPDGTRFAAGTLHQTVRIYDTDSGSASTELKGHSMNARRIVFSPDNRYLVSSADNAMEKYVPTGEIKIFDLHTEAAIRDLYGHANVHSVSPDGSLVFAHDLSWMGRSKDRHRMKVWELATGKLRYELDDVIGSAAFTADGLRFAALYEGGVGVYETTTGTLLLKLPAPRTGYEPKPALGQRPIYPMYYPLTFGKEGTRLILPGLMLVSRRWPDPRKFVDPTVVWYAPQNVGREHERERPEP